MAISREHLALSICVTSKSRTRGCFTSGGKPFLDREPQPLKVCGPRSQSLSKGEDRIAALEAKLRNKGVVLAQVITASVAARTALPLSRSLLEYGGELHLAGPFEQIAQIECIDLKQLSASLVARCVENIHRQELGIANANPTDKNPG